MSTTLLEITMCEKRVVCVLLIGFRGMLFQPGLEGIPGLHLQPLLGLVSVLLNTI